VRRPDGWYIENLENTNETKINGVLLEEAHRLADHDIIKICKYKIAYTSADAPTGGTTRILQTIDLSQGASESARRGKIEQRLRVIMELSADLVGVVDVATVRNKVLEALLRVFPQAERGFVLSRASAKGALVTEACVLRNGDIRRVTPSGTVYDLVIEGEQAVLVEDVALDRRLSESESVGASDVESIICAPLWDQRLRPRAALQLDTRDHGSAFKRADLDFLVAVASTMSMAVENARLHEIEAQHRQTQQEARDAWAVQQSFIPDRCPVVAGYEFWHHYVPARFVGGDYFDYLPLRNTRASAAGTRVSRLAIALGDVSGKGMPAALLMARISTEVRLLLQIEPDPAHALGLLNRSLCENEAAGRFVTFLLLVLDPKRHQLTVVNAGHFWPMVRRAGGQIEVIGENESGPPLGVVDDQGYEAVTTQFGAGELVMLYTDGVNEALSPAGEQFGMGRLERCIATEPGGASSAGQALRSAVLAHAAGQDQFDDITIICLGRS
jgi:serine phosphatase RsbU (regulator of sigma subunit)